MNVQILKLEGYMKIKQSIYIVDDGASPTHCII